MLTNTLFHIDSLSLIMSVLVGFVGVLVAFFSVNFLKGDRKRGSFYLNVLALVLAVLAMVSADHLLFFLVLWGVSNYLLTKLIAHKVEWGAAKNSSILARSNYGLGILFLSGAFYTFYSATGETSIQSILAVSIPEGAVIAGGLLMLFAAMTQSAIWPFHKWLISSLNAPTPVSALMHAGIVNGGGFLLVRFAPLFLSQQLLLGIIFIVGLLTAILGAFYKLIQADIKRMLASSTVSQMGFMFIQCGLGLFSAAVAHLCLHGLFKAYLFLSSSSVVQVEKMSSLYKPSIKQFFIASICGVLGGFVFVLSSGKNLLSLDSNLFLILIAMVGGVQLALGVLQSTFKSKLPLALLAVSFAGAVYGGSIHLVEKMLVSLDISVVQPFNIFYLIGFCLLVAPWLVWVFSEKRDSYPNLVLKMYVYIVNASSPHPSTITSCRNRYQF